MQVEWLLIPPKLDRNTAEPGKLVLINQLQIGRKRRRPGVGISIGRKCHPGISRETDVAKQYSLGQDNPEEGQTRSFDVAQTRSVNGMVLM